MNIQYVSGDVLTCTQPVLIHGCNDQGVMDKLLMWDKPKRAQTLEDWQTSTGFDGGPAGGYVPNMSDQDAQRWRAKLVGKTTGSPQVEIRRTMGSQVLLIVNLGGGYAYKGYKREHTQGVNVHFSANGPLQMTFDELAELAQVVSEAREYLETLSTTTSNKRTV